MLTIVLAMNDRTIVSRVPLDAIAISTPPHRRTSAPATLRSALDVPALSQFPAAQPVQRGWCSPASRAMLLAYWGKPHDISAIVAAVYDERYAGTGNCDFNTVYAGRFGLRAAVVHLAGLDHTAGFTPDGHPQLNDPAQTDIRTSYDRNALERSAELAPLANE